MSANIGIYHPILSLLPVLSTAVLTPVFNHIEFSYISLNLNLYMEMTMKTFAG